MDFEINSKKEIKKIKEFLSITIREDANCSYDKKVYKEVRGVADERVNLIAHEMHLIMNSKNHPYNFLPDNEAWEMYRDSTFNGITIFHGLLEDQLHLLANKICSKLDPHYIKAITYFYGDAVNCQNYSEDYELVIDWLTSEIEWSALSEIQGVLVNIAEKEQELEWEQLAEMEEEEERKAYEIELYSDIETLTLQQAIKPESRDKLNAFNRMKSIQNQMGLKYLTEYNDGELNILTDIIEKQERKLECYEELVEVTEERKITQESTAQLIELKKQISVEKNHFKALKILKVSIDKRFRE